MHVNFFVADMDNLKAKVDQQTAQLKTYSTENK